MERPAIIAGASGLVGGYCLRALLEEPQFDPVVAVSRGVLRVSHPKLIQHKVDFGTITLPDGLAGAAVFCALGTTIRKAGSEAAFSKVDFDYPMRLAEAALAVGATSFALVSSIGADAKSSNFYLRVKGELERRLIRMGYRSLHIFQPSFLLGQRGERRRGEKMGIAVARSLEFLMVGPLKKYRPIEAQDVGRAMIRAVLDEKPGMRTYRWPEIIAVANLPERAMGASA